MTSLPSPDPPEPLPVRMLNEFVYCPRLFFYEWVEGLFAHSVDTVEGEQRHELLERKADALTPAPEIAATPAAVRSGKRSRCTDLSLMPKTAERP